MKKRVLLLTPLLIACGEFFYQAPPPLEAYPQRIPGKPWYELYREAYPAPADAATDDELFDACQGLAVQLPQISKEERFAKIDALIARNREGEFNPGVANYLNELRELAADFAILSSARSYLEDREGRISTDWIPRRPHRYWNQSESSYADALEVYESQRAGALAWIEHDLPLAPPALEANYRVQRASFFFQSGEYAAAANELRGVIEAYSDHPRAEVAAFMLGRCILEDMRRQDHAKLDVYELESFFGPAAEALDSYLRKYPQGRFVPDAHGWRAAVMLEMKRPDEALKDQLARWDSRASRETIRSVIRECDIIIASIFENTELVSDSGYARRGMPWTEIAKRPEVARLFVFQALDPGIRAELPNPDRNLSGDRTALNFLQRRVIAPRPFTSQAMLELGSAMLNAKEGEPDPLTLLVLGWASQMGDEPGQGLALFDRALATVKSDDLLQGRAAALSSLGRHAEAAAAYQELVASFPASSLAQSASFDRAVARFRAGEAGEAFLDLLGRFSGEYYTIVDGGGLHPEFELWQWLDGTAQFGSLDALAKPLATLPGDDPRAPLLRAVVRTRALAAHRFDMARQYLDPSVVGPEPPQEVGYRGRYIMGQPILPELAMDEWRWNKEISPLADAYQRLAAAGGQDPAIHLEIARRWQELRGRVTYPLQQLFDYSESEPEKLDLLRRRNAAFLGVAADAAVKELETRDELDHALAHFLKATELSQDPAIAAPALEGANEILFRLAEFSHYRAVRAVETNAAGLSARLVARLLVEFTDRPETKRAVTWTFTPPLLMGRWMPGDYNSENSADALLASLEYPDPGPPPEPSDHWESAGPDGMENLRKQLQQELEEFNRQRPHLAEEAINQLGSSLQDRISAAAIPGVTYDLYSHYAAGDIPASDMAAGSLFEAHLAFNWEAAKAGNDWWDLGEPEKLIEGWRDYLAKFPDGPRSEAASLRLLRLRVRQVFPVPMIRAFHFPESPIPDGYKHLTPPPPVPDLVWEGLARDLADHDQRFPKRTYAADITQLRSAVAAQMGDYDTALAGLVSILADPMHPELRMTSARYFAEISQRLLDVNQRAGVADAFRKNPAAMPWLRKMVKGDTCLFRLRPLMPWLEGKNLQDPPSP